MNRAPLLILLAALSGAATAAPPGLAELELQRLDQPAREQLRRFAGRPSLLMLFEPDCGWCRRQGQVLEAIQRSCGGRVQVLAVGVRGARAALAAEARRRGGGFPVYQASPAFQALTGDLPATPITLLLDEQLQPLGALRGFRDEQQLAPIVAGLSDGDCRI
jgi:hypothetical protein